MQLLILFLFLIKFIFCSGVELLPNPGQLTEDQNSICGSKNPIYELNTVVISIMRLFASTHLDGPIQIRDRDIITTLNQPLTSVKEQYERFLTELGRLEEKFNLIDVHEQQKLLELTLNTQQNHLELEIHQILKKHNKYMQNIIILAMNLIKRIINLHNLSIPQQQININYNELVNCLNEFRNQVFEYMNSSKRNRYLIDIQHQLNQVNELYNQIMNEFNLISNNFQQGQASGNVNSHGQGSRGV